jgi:hypothetical protein
LWLKRDISDDKEANEAETTMTAVVVMESGSDWPGQLDDSTHVVAFGCGAEDLLQRTRAKLDAIMRRDRGLRVAVLACSAAIGMVPSKERAKLARALFGAVKRTSRGRLILSAAGRAPCELRQELLTLAGALSSELRGSSASISVRFSEVPIRLPARRVKR